VILVFIFFYLIILEIELEIELELQLDMGLVFRKSRKPRKLRKTKKDTRQQKQNQLGGAARMIIKYAGGDIQLAAGQMNIDMTQQYIQGKLKQEPQLEITGLQPGGKYLLTMTDPDALGKTWTHWITEIIGTSNGAGAISISRPEIAAYAPPSPPPGSGVHHYIFRLYDTSTLSRIPSPLKNMSRGDYFAVRLKQLIEGKPILAESSLTIDSSKIKKGLSGKIVSGGINLGVQAGIDALKAFAA
jgi:phosphatidylethanolamine-binding protein (PEBP) family uncharacterized protein